MTTTNPPSMDRDAIALIKGVMPWCSESAQRDLRKALTEVTALYAQRDGLEPMLTLDAFQDATELEHGYRPQVFATGNLINGRDADRYDGWQMALRAALARSTQ